MKASADFVQNDSVPSELAKLSRDPALTFRPDPSFRPKFRNPDEIIESDFNEIEAGACSISTMSPRWTYAAWRRSPKE
jgi:hypothetical protein